MFFHGVTVGHAGDVVGDGAGGVFPGHVLVLGGQEARVVHKGAEEVGEDAPGFVRHAQHLVVLVEVLAEEGFEGVELGAHLWGVADEAGGAVYVRQTLGGMGFDEALGMGDEVNGGGVDHAPDHFMHEAATREAGPVFFGALAVGAEDLNRIEGFERQEARAQAVIDIVIVVGNFVGHVGQLGFEAGAQVVKETFAQGAEGLGMGAGAVFEDAFPRFVHEVEPVEGGVAFFEEVDDAQGLEVVLEAAVFFHAGVEGILPRVAKGGVAQIVREGNGFGKVFVQTQGPGKGAGDLGNFNAVGEAGAEEVAFVIHKDLGFVFEPAKGRGVDDTVPVALELAASMGVGFGEEAPAAHGLGDGIGGEIALGMGEVVVGIHMQQASMVCVICATDAPA